MTTERLYRPWLRYGLYRTKRV